MEKIVTWYQSGGPLMFPLLLAGLAGMLLLVERVANLLRGARVHARPFMERVISLVRSDRIDEAIALCASHQSALPDLGLVILRSRSADEADLRSVAQTQSLAVVPGLTRHVAWLPTLAIAAMLLGVLGAIVNLHDGLMEAARNGGAATPAVLDAVAYALRPLGAGVFIAIPLQVGHAIITSSSRRLVEQLDEFAARLVNALVDRPDVRLGHR